MKDNGVKICKHHLSLSRFLHAQTDNYVNFMNFEFQSPKNYLPNFIDVDNLLYVSHTHEKQ